MCKRSHILCILLAILLVEPAVAADTVKLPLVEGVELQPLAAQVRRVVEALDFLGAPLSKAEQERLREAASQSDEAKGVALIQELLDPHCLAGVNINPEMRVKVAVDPAKPALIEKGWKTFLVKVENQSGATAELRAVSPNAVAVYESGSGTASDKFYKKKGASLERKASDVWLDLDMFNQQPMKQNLSGLRLEYALVQLYSRDAGKRCSGLLVLHPWSSRSECFPRQHRAPEYCRTQGCLLHVQRKTTLEQR